MHAWFEHENAVKPVNIGTLVAAAFDAVNCDVASKTTVEGPGSIRQVLHATVTQRRIDPEDDQQPPWKWMHMNKRGKTEPEMGRQRRQCTVGRMSWFNCGQLTRRQGQGGPSC